MAEIFENIQDALMMVDAQGVIIFANKSYEAMFGVPPEKLIGKNLNSIEPDATLLDALNTHQKRFNRVEKIMSLGGVETIGVAFPIYHKTTAEFIGAMAIFENESRLKVLMDELHRTKELACYLQERLDGAQLPQSFTDIICNSDNMKKILNVAAKVAKTDSTVLIRGESGVGKEVLANAIHNASDRKENPYVKVNCASIPETLLESELFGYENGAFTGARKGGKLGKFELANHGTILLDEIGDMTFDMQAKLLRVLQEKELERVGGTRTIPLDIRVIAATNKDLEKMIKEDQFRSDLYYRLSVMPLNLPPLRERKADILPLARYYLKKLNKQMNYHGDVVITSDTIRIFHSYSWPGNIRELQNVLEHANILRTRSCIEPRHLPKHLRAMADCDDHDCLGGELNLKRAVALLEKEMITEALKLYEGNKSKAIEELGISRRSFYKRLARYGFV